MFDSVEIKGEAQLDDEADEREEMWFPAKSRHDRLWPPVGTSTGDKFLEELKLNDLLTEEERSALSNVCKKFRGAFPSEKDRLVHCTMVQHKIGTGKARPIRQFLRRFSPAEKAEINRQVAEMLELGVITPCESTWASNCVIVDKKDGGYRIAIDHRPLNAVTRKDSYPTGNT